MATFSEQMVTKLQTLLLENPGTQSVTIDGITVSYTDLQKQLSFWEKKVARETGNLLIGKININIDPTPEIPGTP